MGSSLNYVSPNLGEVTVRLGVGNLDADVDEGIVAGTWVDTGTFDDWQSALQSGVASTKNRGRLYILDPIPGTQSFATPVRLDGGDLCGAGAGIGSGVTGVKLDDVDFNGELEIWASDAIGHLWLFGRKNGQWTCRGRSDDLCAYPGFYNNSFPIKDPQTHKTVKLAVVSPGYVILFRVDSSLVAIP